MNATFEAVIARQRRQLALIGWLLFLGGIAMVVGSLTHLIAPDELDNHLQRTNIRALAAGIAMIGFGVVSLWRARRALKH